ncbi:MAG: hypothetical protein ABEJ35_01605 [Halobacteriaceae archaeon]
MRRRRLLRGAAAGLLVTVTGCTGGTGSAPASPPADSSPLDLLPQTPAEMTQIRRTTLPPGDSGAEAGALVEFQATPGVRYYIEILRWPTAEAAMGGVSLYRGRDRAWIIYVTNGPFSYAGAAVGGDESVLIDVMGAADGLSRRYVERADMLSTG